MTTTTTTTTSAALPPEEGLLGHEEEEEMVISSSLAVNLHHQSPSITTTTPQSSSSSSTTTTQRSFLFFEKCTMLELSGSCGDFGTLLPLLVALARERKIYLAPTLLGTGIVHIITGWYWDIPMPLQPMKSIAALAISGGEELSSRIQIAAAGVGMGLIFLGPMTICNVMEYLHRWIPKSVIGGLQLGVGWKLAIKGIQMIQDLSFWFEQVAVADCKLVSIIASILCLYWLRPKNEDHSGSIQTNAYEGGEEGNNSIDNNHLRSSCCQRFFVVDKPPIGIYLFCVGIVMASFKLIFNDNNDQSSSSSSSLLQEDSITTREPFWVNALQNATSTDWKEGLLHGTLPQLPLTTLNSCLSVCMLAHSLFPEKKEGEQQQQQQQQTRNPKRSVSRRSVCISIGLMNLLLCPLGCFPNCHGAGGLAGQYRFGAKTGVSMIVLGMFKIVMSIFAHYGILLIVLDALPISILGVMLVLAGHELALKGIMEVVAVSVSGAGTTNNHPSPPDEQDIMICLVTALVIVGTGQTHVGVLCGWLTYMVYGTGYNDLFCRNDDEGRISDDYDDSSRRRLACTTAGEYQPVRAMSQDDDDDDDDNDNHENEL